MFSRLDSTCIHTVQAAAVTIRSQLKPEITHVANGAAKNSDHAWSPRFTKWFAKQIIGSMKPATERTA